MNLLANENIPLRSSQFLLDQGYDITHIGIVNPSISDEEVMALAIQENRIIITFDSDYGDLVFKYGYKPPGVSYLRLSDFSALYPGELVHKLLLAEELNFHGQFTVVSENNIRQRAIN